MIEENISQEFRSKYGWNKKLCSYRNRAKWTDQ